MCVESHILRAECFSGHACMLFPPQLLQFHEQAVTHQKSMMDALVSMIDYTESLYSC